MTRTTARRLRIEALEDRTVPSFTVAPHFAVGGNDSKPVSVTAADFNEDGHLDAVEWGAVKTAFWGAVLATIRVTPPPPWRPGDAERRRDT